MGDSSSVRIETAQELLNAVSYLLGLSLNGDLDRTALQNRLLSEDFEVLYKLGLKEVEKRVKAGKRLLEKAREGALSIENYAYRNTLKEIELFFERYNIYDFAHNIPCMIDYPLAQPISEKLLGIDYICAYLRTFILENDLCSCFDTETVTIFLKSVCSDYKADLMNIYDAVAQQAVALTLVKSDAQALDFTENDRANLRHLLATMGEAEAEKKWQTAAEALCACLGITDAAALSYLRQTVAELQIRLIKTPPTDSLSALFPSLRQHQEAEKPAVRYIDGTPMEDKKLRTLIDEITSCRYVSDKIGLLKQNAHSIRDYFEILNVSFWDEECLALFDSLSKEEIKYLRLALRQKQSKFPEWTSESGWENYLLDYIVGK